MKLNRTPIKKEEFFTASPYHKKSVEYRTGPLPGGKWRNGILVNIPVPKMKTLEICTLRTRVNLTESELYCTALCLLSPIHDWIEVISPCSVCRVEERVTFSKGK